MKIEKPQNQELLYEYNSYVSAELFDNNFIGLQKLYVEMNKN